MGLPENVDSGPSWRPVCASEGKLSALLTVPSLMVASGMGIFMFDFSREFAHCENLTCYESFRTYELGDVFGHIWHRGIQGWLWGS